MEHPSCTRYWAKCWNTAVTKTNVLPRIYPMARDRCGQHDSISTKDVSLASIIECVGCSEEKDQRVKSGTSSRCGGAVRECLSEEAALSSRRGSVVGIVFHEEGTTYTKA